MRDRSHVRRRGLTLIELLVVVAIVGILATLLLAAVQGARQSARNLRCRDNLKQIGLALSGYVSTMNCLPPGRMRTYDPRYTSLNPPCSSHIDKSFLLHILPFIEQAALYNAINHDLTILGEENTTIWSVSVAAYACPSDGDASPARELSVGTLKSYGMPVLPDGPRRMAYTSYSGCFGSLNTLALPQEKYHCMVSGEMTAQNNGCLNDRSPVTLASISDGLSQTIVVSEKANGAFRALDRGDPGTVEFDRHGWLITGNFGDTLFTGLYPPNSYKSGGIWDDIISSASSYHPGGINVLMGDGSVRFVKETIQSWPLGPDKNRPVGATFSARGHWENLPAPGVWQALCTRSGGEIVASDEF